MENLVGGQTKKGASKTKIVWTLGPSSRSVEKIEKLLKAGMSVARFNFSHGSHAYHQETLDNLRTAVKNTGILCAVMLDTKGPDKIRTGFLKEGKPIELVEGQEITISVDETIKGDSNIISMSYKKLAEDLKPGDMILCSDGMIALTVLSCDKDLGYVRCRCEDSAVLGEEENVYLPGNVVDLPILTEKDKEDILQWGVPNKIDIIALSSVRKGSDLDEVSELLGEHRESIMLMSKVENEEAWANFDEIMKKSDAVMVVRGKLGMVMQKTMINKANVIGKPIVTVIPMNPELNFPRRSEVAVAVLDGTDCVMLSGVKSDGVTAVETMSRICKEVEDSINYEAVQRKIIEAVPRSISQMERTASNAISKLFRVLDFKAIIVLSGYKAELVAKYRPSVPILAVVDPECPELARRGLVYRGIIPLIREQAFKSPEEEIDFAVQFAKKEGICRDRDLGLGFQLVRAGPISMPVCV